MRGERLAATVVFLALGAGCDRAPAPPAVPPPGAASPPATATGRPSASAMLARMQARYANARTYRDTGTCESTMSGARAGASGHHVRFTTALDRGAGMRWRAEHSDGAGEPGTFTATSKDCVTFDWTWPFAMNSGTRVTAWKAFSESLGNTFGIAGLVPALLLPSVDLKYIRLNPSQLTSVTDAGDETIDGTTCYVVDADGWHGKQIRLWLDASGALRQFWASRTAPASFDIPAYTVTIMARYAPEFDVAIRPEELAPEGR